MSKVNDYLKQSFINPVGSEVLFILTSEILFKMKNEWFTLNKTTIY